jgi:hypothetical protein
MKRAETDGLFALSCGHGILAAQYRGISRRLQANAAPSAILPSACSRAKTDSFVIVNVARRFNPRSGAPSAKRVLPRTGRNPGSEVAASASPSTLLGALTHSTLLRVILSLPAVSQTLSLSNGSLSNPSNG